MMDKTDNKKAEDEEASYKRMKELEKKYEKKEQEYNILNIKERFRENGIYIKACA